MTVSCSGARNGKSLVVSAILPGGLISAKILRSDLEPTSLFEFAARANSRRAFLLLSKVLGKHVPACPRLMAEVHRRIARLLPPLPEPVAFVGMAETATGLGHGIFEAWLAHHRGISSVFVHTTRYRVSDAEFVEFEEAHSHAPCVYLHVPAHEPARSHFLSARSLILIDDEITTGNTLAKLAAACIGLIPSVKRVHLACITDFMGDKNRLDLDDKIGRATGSSALLTGEYSFQPCNGSAVNPGPAQRVDGNQICIEDKGFGRLGRTTRLTLPKSILVSLARRSPTHLPSLVLGTGEFMHPAFVLAHTLQQRGNPVLVQATTRTPILEWGPVVSTLSFTDNYGEGIRNYIYGLEPSRYYQILICCETDRGGHLNEWARLIGARLIDFSSDECVEEASLY